MAYDLVQLRDKFFSDPDWRQMEELLNEYLEPMRSVLNIPDDLTNDQLATEVRGRKLTIEKLEKFLSDSHIIRNSTGKVSFK